MKLRLGVVLSVIGMGFASYADFTQFADFEQYSDNQKLAGANTNDTTDGWITSSDANNRSIETRVKTDGGGNKYLLHHKSGALGGFGTVTQAGSGFRATTNPSDGYQTLFFRFMVDSTLSTAGKVGFGIAADATHANPLFKTGFKVDGSGNILDNASSLTNGTIQLDTWYKAWFAVDHRGTGAGSNVRLYLQSDNDVNYSTQTQVPGNFYSNGGAAVYDTLLFTGEHLNGLNLAVDDIYYDNSGENLADPLGPALYGYAAWAIGWGQSIGSETNDFDADNFNNFFEYVFNGDPTNNAVYGENIVLESDAGNVSGIYVQRNDDTNLVYSLETSSDLTSPSSWTNTGYTAVGTNVTGGAYDYVTNSISTATGQLFLRLKVNQ